MPFLAGSSISARPSKWLAGARFSKKPGSVGALKLVGVYSDPRRDPRGHSVSVAFTTLLPGTARPQAGSDASAAMWVADWRSLDLAFDHAEIVADAEKIKLGGKSPAASRLGGSQAMLYLRAITTSRSQCHE